MQSPETTCPAAATPILERAAHLLQRYDVIFCDVWGVIHDGRHAYDSTCDALTKFRAAGGTVVLVSNAPVPNDRVAAMLGERQVPRSAWDAIVSSGDIALRHVRDKGYTAIYRIGPAARDSALFRALPGRAAPLDQAEAIICTGLVDDLNEAAEHYRPLLVEARTRALPFVCANPDLVVDVGGRLYVCAGAIAELYSDLGGDVFWAGKPHASAYETAAKVAQELRGADVAKSRILAIGDAVRTDLAGAARAGVDCIFIAAGIHRHEVTDNGRILRERLDALLAPPAARPVAAMYQLAW